jgi:hypothetical protein
MLSVLETLLIAAPRKGTLSITAAPSIPAAAFATALFGSAAVAGAGDEPSGGISAELESPPSNHSLPAGAGLDCAIPAFAVNFTASQPM